jgi:cyclohexadienyl dehydratase
MTYARRVFSTALLMAATALVLPARAQDRPDAARGSHLNRILDTGVVRVGTTGDFPPMTSRDPDSRNYVGYDIDAANELAKDLGVKVQFVATDWKTLINGMVADKYDIVMSGVSMSLERAKVAGFTQPYFEFSTVPVLRAKNADRFKSWADIDQKGVTVATTLGTVFDAQARDFFKTATLRQVEAPALGFQEVLSGRADITITSNVDAAALIRRYPELAVVPVDSPRARRPASFLMPQNDPVWINYMNSWITIKRMLGFFDELDKKWIQVKG